MNVAFIPVRGGSKSIPLKNIKKMNGHPLVYWTLVAAVNCPYIDRVYVATDSNRIKESIEQYELNKVEVIGRSEESALDTASTEFAMLEFVHNFDFDNIVLIQATSPLLVAEDLNSGFELFNEPGTDSVLSAVKQKRFNWQTDKNGYAQAMNYDVFARPRRQDFNGYYVENGAFYITSRQALIETKNRISGNIKIAEMPEDTFYEIDELNDWFMIENLMKKRRSKEADLNIPEIKMFLTDSDGCLTDGGMYYTESGDEIKKFNAKDGMGFQRLREQGILTGIITGEARELIKRRSEKLKLDILEMGIADKLSVAKKLCKKYNISMQNVAYVGDDVNDIEMIRAVGFGCSVNNAIEEVKKNAVYITKVNGGDGAIREVIDLILSNKK